MKIACVMPTYYPHMGGVERVVKNVYERLSKSGFNVTVFTTDIILAPNEIQHEIINGVKVLRFFVLSPGGSYHIPGLRMLIKLLAEDFDIIHIYNIQAITAVAGWVAYRILRQGHLFISPYYHGGGHSNMANILWNFYRPLAKNMITQSKVLITNSSVARRLLISHFEASPEKIRIVYDGIDIENIRRAEPFQVNEKIMLYVGRVEKYKNVHMGIYLLKYLPKDFKYVIIGNGTFLNNVRKIAVEEDLKERVIFLGYQPDDVVWRWLKTAQIFLHFSERESFGMTCLEALASGTPVVLNDDKYGLRETALLFPKCIKMLKLRDVPVQKLARSVLETSELKPVSVDLTRFTWDHIAKQYAKLYHEMN